MSRIFTAQVVTLIAVSFALGTSEFIVIGILPEVAAGTGVSVALAGALISVFAAAYAVCTPCAAALGRRIPRFRLLLILFGVFLAGDALSVLAQGFAMLAAARIVTASVSGAILATSMTFVLDTVAPTLRAKTISFIFAGFSISSVIGMPLGAAVCQLAGWRWAFVLAFAVALLVLGLVLRYLPRTAPPPAGTRPGGVGALMRDARTLLGLAMVTGSAAGSYVCYTYLTPLLEDELGVPAAMISGALILFGVVQIASNLLAGRIAERGGLHTVRWVFAAQAVCLAVLPLAVGWTPAGLLAVGLVGLLMYLMNATCQLHFMDVAVKDYPATVGFASSLSSVSFNVGIAAGSALGSVVVDTAGLPGLGYAGAALAVIAAAAAFAAVRLERDPAKRTAVS